MATSIVEYTNKMHVYGGEIWNGSSVRYLKLIVVYDERGPLNTNYTASGCGKWHFETKRRIPIRVVTEPDWKNPNGFLVKADKDYWIDGNIYTLFVNRDNINDSDYVEGEWSRYTSGSVQKIDRIGGCEFNRIVGNAEYDKTQKHLDECVRVLKELTEKLYSGNIGASIDKISSACKNLELAHNKMLDIHERVYAMPLNKLVNENGGNEPINERDWCGIVTPDSCAYLPYIVGTY